MYFIEQKLHFNVTENFLRRNIGSVYKMLNKMCFVKYLHIKSVIY